jgi:hypothetical protein
LQNENTEPSCESAYCISITGNGFAQASVAERPIAPRLSPQGEVSRFTDKQIALVAHFAAQAVIAIENARLLNELKQSLEQQTATTEVLRVISSSPGDLQPVFASMLANAVGICDANFGNIYRYKDNVWDLAATHNTPQALIDAHSRLPLSPDPGTPFGRMMAAKEAVHITDLSTLAMRSNWKAIVAR